MKRVFAFGCSFTHYAWPSYADYLGYEFDSFSNWAHPGLGNKAIAERVAECHIKNNFTKDDIILVQWSSHMRNDWHTFNPLLFNKDSFLHSWFRDTNKIGWKTQGSIFNQGNSSIYDNEWIDRFWDERSYFMHTMNQIALTQGLLESTGCTWKMTSIGKLDQCGTDMPFHPDHGESSKPGKASMWEREPALKCYQTVFDNYKENWMSPIGLYTWDNPDDAYWFQSPDDKEPWLELHPSHVHHYNYLNDIVRPSLGIEKENCNKQNDLYNQLSQFRKEHKDLFGFEQRILDELVDINTGYEGF